MEWWIEIVVEGGGGVVGVVIGMGGDGEGDSLGPEEVGEDEDGDGEEDGAERRSNSSMLWRACGYFVKRSASES